MTEEMVTVSTYLPRELAEKLEKQAVKKKWHLSQLIREILKEWGAKSK